MTVMPASAVSERWENTEMVLDEQFSNTCTKLKVTTNMVWQCDSAVHCDDRHYYVRRS